MTTHVPDHASAKRLLDADAISKSLARIAHELIERNAAPGPGLSRVALVGIQTRGVPLASRLRHLVEERSGVRSPSARSTSRSTETTCTSATEGGPIVSRSCARRASRFRSRDDGRSRRRRALHGPHDSCCNRALRSSAARRACSSRLLVDRGHRELPIRPDYVGKNLPTGRGERVQVELVEIDERDGVLLVAGSEDGDHI